MCTVAYVPHFFFFCMDNAATKLANIHISGCLARYNIQRHNIVGLLLRPVSCLASPCYWGLGFSFADRRRMPSLPSWETTTTSTSMRTLSRSASKKSMIAADVLCCILCRGQQGTGSSRGVFQFTSNNPATTVCWLCGKNGARILQEFNGRKGVIVEQRLRVSRITTTILPSQWPPDYGLHGVHR